MSQIMTKIFFLNDFFNSCCMVHFTDFMLYIAMFWFIQCSEYKILNTPGVAGAFLQAYADQIQITLVIHVS